MLDRHSGSIAHCLRCSRLSLRRLCKSRSPRSHLQSGSPCPHKAKCWRRGDWAKGGRERSEVKLKIIIIKKILFLKMNIAKVTVREKTKIRSRIGFAHRLDCRRILSVSDGTFCPGVIGRRRLRSRSNSKKV